jgi:carboxypeptidase Taq
MAEDDARLYRQACDHNRQTALLGSIQAVLEWDERTMLPSSAAEYRAEQIVLLSGLGHQRQTDPRYGEWLGRLAASPLATDPYSDAGATIRELRRQYDRAVKLPQSLVEAIARAGVLGQHAWQEARRTARFSLFQPCLEEMLALKRQQAEALGYPQSPYDALLDEYEPGALASDLTRILAALGNELAPLVAEIHESGRRGDLSVLQRHFPPEAQEAFGRETAARIGFDFQRGRLDPTVHPFCTRLGPHDCRITTRYHPQHFNAAFFGILHEAGHALYEQGLSAQHFGLPLGSAVSLGIHESQSRLWENMVGRSFPFWQYLYGDAQRRFPESLGDVPRESFFFAVNDVRPSLIRVEADEATYNLHILIRFELEQALLTDDLRVADLPGAWNAAYQKYLSVEPRDDAGGVLQDVHWSAGLIGYFPTYALGNLAAAQFYAAADEELGGLDQKIAEGQFLPLREWLRDKVYSPGQRYPAGELIRRATGRPLSHQPLIQYLRAKLGPLYGLG